MDVMLRTLKVMLLALVLNAAGLPSACAQDAESKPQNAPSRVSPPAWKSVEIGDFYFRRKRFVGALSRYQEAVKTDPNYAPAYLGLGKVYEKMGLKQKALEAYQRYLDELPSEKQADEAKDVHRAIDRLHEELGKSQPTTAKRP
jgi:tetratricopeptide (TPR) repeat protein